MDDFVHRSRARARVHQRCNRRCVFCRVIQRNDNDNEICAEGKLSRRPTRPGMEPPICPPPPDVLPAKRSRHGPPYFSSLLSPNIAPRYARHAVRASRRSGVDEIPQPRFSFSSSFYRARTRDVLLRNGVVGVARVQRVNRNDRERVHLFFVLVNVSSSFRPPADPSGSLVLYGTEASRCISLVQLFSLYS